MGPQALLKRLPVPKSVQKTNNEATYRVALHSVVQVLMFVGPVMAEWQKLGFSSTFQQNVASLAVARAVRRRVPKERVAILFGGANCEGEMGRAVALAVPLAVQRVGCQLPVTDV